MGNVVSLRERAERKQAEEHARALVLSELAAVLVRQQSPALLRLIAETFGPDEVERRVQATISPRRMTDAPRHVSKLPTRRLTPSIA